MKEKRHLFFFICIGLSVLMIAVLILYIFGFPHSPKDKSPFPDSGTWICEELNIILRHEEESASIIINGQIIDCDCWSEIGSADIYIDCNEQNNPAYEYRHRFFSGSFLKNEGNVFYIQEHDSKNIYSFRRIPD